MNYTEYIKGHTLRCEVSYRGGGIEVDVTELLGVTDYGASYKMTAYQNYLGGGMTGSIQTDYNFNPDELTGEQVETFTAFEEQLKRYFYSLNNGGGHDDEHSQSGDFEEQQRRAVSAY